jgi:hypothetical protein
VNLVAADVRGHIDVGKKEGAFRSLSGALRDTGYSIIDIEPFSLNR